VEHAQAPTPAPVAQGDAQQSKTSQAGSLVEAAVSKTAPSVGMVPVYVHVPADKLDKVMSAIGRAIK
jgi:hypothetical protein